MSIIQYDVLFDWWEDATSAGSAMTPGGGGRPTPSGPNLPPGAIPIPDGYMVYIAALDKYATYVFEEDLGTGDLKPKFRGYADAPNPAKGKEPKGPQGAISEKELRDKGADFDTPGIAVLNGIQYVRNPDGTYDYKGPGKEDKDKQRTAAQYLLGLKGGAGKSTGVGVPPTASGRTQGRASQQGSGMVPISSEDDIIGGLFGAMTSEGYASHIPVGGEGIPGGQGVALGAASSPLSPQFVGSFGPGVNIGSSFDPIWIWASATNQDPMPKNGVGWGTPEHLKQLGIPTETGQAGNPLPAAMSVMTQRAQSSIEHPTWDAGEIQSNIFDIIRRTAERRAQAGMQRPEEVAPELAASGGEMVVDRPHAIVDLATQEPKVIISEGGQPERIGVQPMQQFRTQNSDQIISHPELGMPDYEQPMLRMPSVSPSPWLGDIKQALLALSGQGGMQGEPLPVPVNKFEPATPLASVQNPFGLGLTGRARRDAILRQRRRMA